jgi:rRNA-processing protein FCF1
MTPLDGIDRLLIDGNNLLHRVSGNVEDGSIRLLLARLNAAIPSNVATIVMLDGHPASGTDRRQRIRRGLDVHHAGSLSADDALLNIVRDMSIHDRAAAFLVTDDRGLSEKARRLGARTQRLAWLEALIERPAATAAPARGASIGRKGIRSASSDIDTSPRQPWKPGRGATVKRGNGKREKR